MVEVVGTGIVRDIQVGPAIVVEVAPDSLHTEVMLVIVHAGRFRDIFKGAITAVVEQEVRLARKSPWSTLHHDTAETAKLIIAAEFRQVVDVNQYVSRHKQIYTPIAIKVTPGGACTESANSHTRFFRHVFKSAVAKVPIEGVATIPGNIDVVP